MRKSIENVKFDQRSNEKFVKGSRKKIPPKKSASNEKNFI